MFSKATYLLIELWVYVYTTFFKLRGGHLDSTYAGFEWDRELTWTNL